MNILLDKLPNTVSIDGVDYLINTDFRIGIQFEMLLEKQEISDKEKIKQALLLYYPVLPENLVEAINQLLWFYSCNLIEKKSR